MTMPLERIRIKCPQCGNIYKDCYRPSINFTLADYDDDFIEEATTSTCPHCNLKVHHNTLVVSKKNGVWNFCSGYDEIEHKVDYFKKPKKLWKPEEIIDNSKIVPKVGGIYGWYFDVLPPRVPVQNYIEIDGWKLLYVGIAPRNQRSPSTLRKRVKGKHLGNNADVSTVRKSLGALPGI